MAMRAALLALCALSSTAFRAPRRLSASPRRCAAPCGALPGGASFSVEVCSCDAALAIDGKACDDARDGDVWVAAKETAAPAFSLSAAMEAATTDAPVVVVGAPAAVGRLRPRRGGAAPVVDVLRTSIPKEQTERCAEAQAAVLTKLLELWLESLGDGDHFEDLRASATIHTAAALESFGFAEIEFPDLTALGRDAAIETHAARLPAAILAFDALAAASPAAAAVAETLRAQPPPPAGDLNAPQPERDPWAGVKFKL